MQQRSVPAVLGALVAMLAAAGCRTEPSPTIEYSRESTEDGLHLTRTATDHTVYTRPGARIQSYTEIVIDPFMISYAPAPDAAGGGSAAVRTLDPEAEARFTAILREAFVQEMERSEYFRVVEQPGAATLRVQGWIYELAVHEPYRDDPRNFPLCLGEMNLILNVRDARTAEPLARINDRLAISCRLASTKLYYFATWRGIEGAMRDWGSFLRASLDELHALPDLPAAR